MKKKNDFIVGKSTAGITLIALVITIIVLLILAGVAISMLAGENGILNKAANAVTKTEQSSTEEAVKLAVLSAMTVGNGKIQGEEVFKTLNEELEKTGYDRGDLQVDGSYLKDITSLPATIVINEKAYTISSNGEVTIGDKLYIGSVNNQNGEELKIGDYITYNGIDWVVMYNDSENGLQIISTSTKPAPELVGKDGYNNAIPILNEEASKYKVGKEAIFARVLGTSPRIQIEGDITEYFTNDFITEDNRMIYSAEGTSQATVKDFEPFAEAVMSNKILLDKEFLVGIRDHEKFSNYVDFEVIYLNSNLIAGQIKLYRINSDGTAENISIKALDDAADEPFGTTTTMGILPIITLDERIVIQSGSGAQDDPYVYTFNE